MQETMFVEISGLLTAGFALLGRDEFLKVSAVDTSGTDAKKPTPPTGYTHAMALAHVASYKAEWEEYANAANGALAYRLVGASFLNHIDAMPPAAAKKALAELQTLSVNRGIGRPELDSYQVGLVLWGLASIAGTAPELRKITTWLMEALLPLDQQRVAEEIKSPQREGERPATGGGEGQDTGPRKGRRPNAKG